MLTLDCIQKLFTLQYCGILFKFRLLLPLYFVSLQMNKNEYVLLQDIGKEKTLKQC